MKSIYDKISEAQKENLNFAICTIVQVKGSTPRKTGAKMIVYEDGGIFGTIGGGDLEKKVIMNAHSVIRNREPKSFRHDLLNQHDMCCGGTVDIFIEPVMKKNKLYIFGAGHTGHALANMAISFDFEVVLIDDRKEYIDVVKTEEISKMNLPFSHALSVLPFDHHTYVCVMTYSHPLDREILSICLNKPFAYLGMIGSIRKVEMTKKIFIDTGVGTADQLNLVDMPMGIDILAEGPEEIAISIMAKLIAVKNKVY